MRDRTLDEYLGAGTEHGDEVSYCCPFCVTTGRAPDTEEKLWYNTAKKLFFCYRCETKGPLAYLLRFLGAPEETHVELNEYTRRIMKLRGFAVDSPEPEAENGDIVYDYTPHLIENGCTGIIPGGKSWLYLRKRGITDELIEYYQMVDGRGRYRFRVVVPTFDAESRVSFFVARAIKKLTYVKNGVQMDSPKYLNPKGEGRKRSIFNLNRAVNYENVVVTEGVFSAIAAGKNAVATFGKLVTDTQVKMLVDACADREIIVCLDGDAHAQTLNLASRLNALKMNVSMVILPFEHDPDSIGSAALMDLMEARVPYTEVTAMRLITSGAVNLAHKPKVAPAVTTPSPDLLSKLRERLTSA